MTVVIFMIPSDQDDLVFPFNHPDCFVSLVVGFGLISSFPLIL